jgi:hypothetical protein
MKSCSRRVNRITGQYTAAVCFVISGTSSLMLQPQEAKAAKFGKIEGHMEALRVLGTDRRTESSGSSSLVFGGAAVIGQS